MEEFLGVICKGRQAKYMWESWDKFLREAWEKYPKETLEKIQKESRRNSWCNLGNNL